MIEKNLLTFIVILFLVNTSIAQQKPAAAEYNKLKKEFKNPPVIARPKALWPWVNGNFSLSQITYEMEQAKLKGMGGFDIWDVGTTIDENNLVPDGPPFLGDASLQGIKHAVLEAERLDLELGLISSSSWNAGGSWIKQEHGAMGLFRSDTIVVGPSVFNSSIAFPNIQEKKDKNRPSLIQFDSSTGLPVYFKEVAYLAHPLIGDSIIRDTVSIINLQSKLKGSQLQWNVPPGKWRIIRYVCAPTGQPLMLPSPKSNGLMVDHFSAAAQEANMDYIFKRLKSVLGSLKNRSLKYVYEDSYEVNSAVWTPLLAEEFEKKNGYSLINYLPILDGQTIISKDFTERFLFDFTKLLSELIIKNHYERGRKLSEKEGLGFYAEAGGPGKPIHNVPFEDLKALGSLTVPRGEFWNKIGTLELLQIIKGISSAAHIYNQRYVEAEAFTSVWLWQEGPGELKPLADRAMCEGLNRFVYHTFPHTPPESGTPGWVYNFGTLINTTNGWWQKSEGFHQYLGRCSYLLQQGEFVGDVAFYYGDQAPNFVAPKYVHPTLGLGYDYDVVNTEIILNKMTVKNGKIYLPHGQFYEVLVLPQDQKINPLVLKKLEQLAAAGATIVGPKPTGSYSLSDHKMNDREIQLRADKLWGKTDSLNIQENIYGKGKIVWGKSVRDVLMKKGITPDLIYESINKNDSVDYIHRRTPEAEIYFIRNKKDNDITGTCTFRVTGKQPEWWDPQTGETFPITTFSTNKNGITIPLNLAAEGSAFIVFKARIATNKLQAEVNAPESIIYTTKGVVSNGSSGSSIPQVKINTPWEVRYQHIGNTPVVDSMKQLIPWNKSSDSIVRNFSGMATYYNSFEINAGDLKTNQVLLMSLNNVKEIADVYLNGIKLGQHWHSSHVFALDKELKEGTNHLVIEVVNSINNRLIGDARKPSEFRNLRSNISRLPNAWMNPFADAKLIDAGLIGPIEFQWTLPVK